MKQMRIGTFLLLAIAASTSLLAHDMWIEPTAFRTEVGRIIGVRLRVGQDLLGDPIPRDPALIHQFVSLDASGRKPVVGREGADPAGLIRIAEPGLTILGYHSNPSPVTLSADKFNLYLKEEGLDAVAAMRAQRNESGKEAHEIFTRCAKSLVTAGAAVIPAMDRALGLPLELIAGRNPYAMGVGDELPLTLTYQGRALADVLVVAINRRNPAAKVSAKSDANGRVALKLADPGVWLVKAVHMIPAPAGSQADWASYWASLTFELKTAGSTN